MEQSSEGGSGLRDAERVRREVDDQLTAVRALGPQVASLRAQLAQLRETNHFRENWVAMMMREHGHRG